MEGGSPLGIEGFPFGSNTCFKKQIYVFKTKILSPAALTCPGWAVIQALDATKALSCLNLGSGPGLNPFPVQCFRAMRPKLWGLVDLRPVCVPRRLWELLRGFPGDAEPPNTVGKRKRGPEFSSEHPKLWGTGKGASHSALSPPTLWGTGKGVLNSSLSILHCGKQEPHIQFDAPGSAEEEETRTPRMQKGFPISQDPPHSLSTKKEL